MLDGDDWTDEADDVCCETGDWTGRSISSVFPSEVWREDEGRGGNRAREERKGRNASGG